MIVSAYELFTIYSLLKIMERGLLKKGKTYV